MYFWLLRCVWHTVHSEQSFHLSVCVTYMVTSLWVDSVSATLLKARNTSLCSMSNCSICSCVASTKCILLSAVPSPLCHFTLDCLAYHSGGCFRDISNRCFGSKQACLQHSWGVRGCTMCDVQWHVLYQSHKPSVMAILLMLLIMVTTYSALTIWHPLCSSHEKSMSCTKLYNHKANQSVTHLFGSLRCVVVFGYKPSYAWLQSQLCCNNWLVGSTEVCGYKTFVWVVCEWVCG